MVAIGASIRALAGRCNWRQKGLGHEGAGGRLRHHPERLLAARAVVAPARPAEPHPTMAKLQPASRAGAVAAPDLLGTLGLFSRIDRSMDSSPPYMTGLASIQLSRTAQPQAESARPGLARADPARPCALQATGRALRRLLQFNIERHLGADSTPTCVSQKHRVVADIRQ